MSRRWTLIALVALFTACPLQAADMPTSPATQDLYNDLGQRTENLWDKHIGPFIAEALKERAKKPNYDPKEKPPNTATIVISWTGVYRFPRVFQISKLETEKSFPAAKVYVVNTSDTTGWVLLKYLDRWRIQRLQIDDQGKAKVVSANATPTELQGLKTYFTPFEANAFSTITPNLGYVEFSFSFEMPGATTKR